MSTRCHSRWVDLHWTPKGEYKKVKKVLWVKGIIIKKKKTWKKIKFSILFNKQGFFDRIMIPDIDCKIQCFFFPEKKKVLPEKIFKILPEKICKCPRKNLKNCPRKKSCTREKISKITPEKKKSVGAKKIKNSTREKSKSTREKIHINIGRKNTE